MRFLLLPAFLASGLAHAQLMSQDELKRQAQEAAADAEMAALRAPVGKTYWIVPKLQVALNARNHFYSRYQRDSTCANLKYADKVYPTEPVSFTVVELISFREYSRSCHLYRVTLNSGQQLYLARNFTSYVSRKIEHVKSDYVEPVLPVPLEEILAEDAAEQRKLAEEKARKDAVAAQEEEMRQRQWAADQAAYRKLPDARVGMKAEAVYNSRWGEPDSVNTLKVQGRVREQWVYARGYLYLENGKVVAIQEFGRR